MERKGFALNADSDWLWYIYEACGKDVADFEEKIKAYVAGYADRGISDLFVCLFCQTSIFPSKTMTWLGDNTYKKTENGVPVDYSGVDRCRHLVDIYRAMKRDPFDVLVEETRAQGMAAWLSVRMNDCHFSHAQTSWLRGDLYYEAKAKGYFIGDDVVERYYGECFDYGHPYVRQKMLDYVREVLDRYDMDGLELDFQREIFCFRYFENPDCRRVMTEFLADVHRHILKKEAERGHKIKLAVHLLRDVACNKTFGFDVETWVSEGLVDVLIPASRWKDTDSDMPIAAWKRLAAPHGVEVYAGLEAFLAYPIANRAETLAGFAAQYLAAGADKIYVYNLFRTRAYDHDILTDEQRRALDSDYPAGCAQDGKENSLHALWEACRKATVGEPQTRRHVMTYMEHQLVPRGETGYEPLPARIAGKQTFTMQTGESPGETCTVYVGVSKGDAPPALFVDGGAATLDESDQAAYIRVIPPPNNAYGLQCADHTKTDVYAYRAAPGAGSVRTLTLSGEDVTVTYLEIKFS